MVLCKHKHISTSQISETIGKLCTFGNDAASPRAVDGEELVEISAQDEAISTVGEFTEVPPIIDGQKRDLINHQNRIDKTTVVDAFECKPCEGEGSWTQIVRRDVCRANPCGVFQIKGANKMRFSDARSATDCQILSPTNGGSSLLLGQKIPSPQSGCNPAVQQGHLGATQLGISRGNPKNCIRRASKRQRKNLLKSLLPTRPTLCAIPERSQICESYF
jgi:hypothetical protein